MKNFRSLSFFNFIQSQGFTTIWGVMFGFFLCLIIGSVVLNLSANRFPVGLIVLPILSFGIFMFLSGGNYNMYARGRDAVQRVATNKLKHTVIKNVKVQVRNYMRFQTNRRREFPTFSQTLYDFTRADICLTPTALILMGHGSNGFFHRAYAAPIILVWKELEPPFPNPNMGKIIEVVPNNTKKQILIIQDPNVTKPITLVFDWEDRLGKWVTERLLADF